LAQGDYHKVADHTLEGILEVLETIGDEHDIDGYDVEYSVSEHWGFFFYFYFPVNWHGR
jgi:frataxin-like iron-binding protein CyaY